MPERPPARRSLRERTAAELMLDREIALLRDLLERLMDATEAENDRKELFKMAEIAGRTAARLGVLVATQRRLSSASDKSSDLSDELAATVAELARRYPVPGFEEK